MGNKLSPLGKGLDAILPKAFSDANESILSIPIADIAPNKYQPRLQFNDNDIQQLADSIRQNGLTQPIVVRPASEGYELIVGERRLRATKKAGLTEINAIVRSVTNREALQLALVENIDRKDLNPIEEAKSFKRLSEEFELTHQEIASTFKRSRSAITNSLRLLKLPLSIQSALISGILTPGHARTILRLETEEEQLSFLENIKVGNLSVRDVESQTNAEAKPYTPAEKIDFSQLEKALEDTFRLKPKIKGSWDKGSIQLQYTSKDELDYILKLFKTIVPEQTMLGD